MSKYIVLLLNNSKEYNFFNLDILFFKELGPNPALATGCFLLLLGSKCRCLAHKPSNSSSSCLNKPYGNIHLLNKHKGHFNFKEKKYEKYI